MANRDESPGPDPPERFGSGVRAAADAISGMVRLGLELGATPLQVLPHSARAGIARMARFAVDASAIVPHAVARGVAELARELDE